MDTENMNDHSKVVVGRPFPPGVSGNPGGRPKEVREVIDLARSHSPAAVETLASIMRNEEAPPAARIAAANAILDRAYGRPKETLETRGVTLEQMLVSAWKDDPRWPLPTGDAVG
jgi:hypothetical protein